MHNSESAQENETHELLWDFEIQVYHQNSARQPNLFIVNKKKKKTYRILDFVERKRKKR